MRFLILTFLLLTNIIHSQSDILYEKSLNYLEKNEIDSAAYYFRKAYKKSPISNSKYDVSYSKILKILGKPDSSYFYLDKAEKEIKKNNIPDSILLIYALKAELSRSTVSKALNDQTISDSELFYKVNKNKFRNIDIVAYYFNRKMASFNAFHSNSKDTTQLIFDIANDILKLESKIKNKEVVAYTLNEIAQVYEYRINGERSLEYYEKANQYSKTNQLNSALIDNTLNYARYVQIKEKDLNKAISILLSEEPVVKLNSDVNQVTMFYEYLCDLFAANKEFENAYEYYKKMAIKRLEIERNKSNLYIKDLEFENKINSKQNELNLEKQKLEDAKKTQHLFYLIVLMILIGVLVLVFYNKKINKKNKELEHLSSENEFLLSEANHRINNNLQLITILISEEIKKENKNETSGIKKILSKVESIATLHRHLYKSENKKKINIQEYLSEIKNNFQELFEVHNIKEQFNVESYEIETDVAMYLGLLLTELYINTIKHAFPEKQLKKEIEFKLIIKENNLIFTYQNNGENSMDKKNAPKLVSKICRQLKVNCEIETSKGFQFQFFKNI